MKTKLLNNKTMSPGVYKLRQEVIKLIKEAGKLTPLPRIEVRITDAHPTRLGVARMGGKVIWITEDSVASRSVVFHEILHAVFNQPHVSNCPLMAPKIDPNLRAQVCDELFLKYVNQNKLTSKKKPKTSLSLTFNPYEARPL